MSTLLKPCGFADLKENKCLLTGMIINPESCHCSSYRAKINRCGHCGQYLFNEIIDLTNPEEPHFICDKCAPGLNSCATCKHSRTCAFEADTTLTKIVQQTIRNGPMTQIVQIRNPELVSKTCKAGCPCFDSENECMKQFNYCERKE